MVLETSVLPITLGTYFIFVATLVFLSYYELAYLFLNLGLDYHGQR